MRRAADLVGNHAGDRGDQRDSDGGGERRHKSDRRRQFQRFDHIGRHVDDEVVDRSRYRERADRENHTQFLPREYFPNRRFPLGRGRRRRVDKMPADVKADGPDQNAEQKRKPPAPGLQIARCHPIRQRGAETGSKQSAYPLARELPACDEPSTFRRMLDQKGGRTSEFAAGGKSLHQTRDDDRDRRENTDGRIGRHQRHRKRTGRHHDDGDHQRRLAAVTIGIGPKQNAADRADQERQAESPEGQKQRCRLVVAWKKRLRDIDGEIGVNGDIKPFQRIPDRCRDDELRDVPLFRFCGDGGQFDRSGQCHLENSLR